MTVVGFTAATISTAFFKYLGASLSRRQDDFRPTTRKAPLPTDYFPGGAAESTASGAMTESLAELTNAGTGALKSGS